MVNFSAGDKKLQPRFEAVWNYKNPLLCYKNPPLSVGTILEVSHKFYEFITIWQMFLTQIKQPV